MNSAACLALPVMQPPVLLFYEDRDSGSRAVEMSVAAMVRRTTTGKPHGSSNSARSSKQASSNYRDLLQGVARAA